MILSHAFISPDNRRLAHVCGPLDEHLRSIEAALNVDIRRRNDTFRVEGERSDAERTVALLQQIYDQAAGPLEPVQLQLMLLQAMQGDERPGAAGEASAAEPDLVLRTRRPPIWPGAPSTRRPTCATSSATTSPSASARPAPARPFWRWRVRSTRWSATPCSASS